MICLWCLWYRSHFKHNVPVKSNLKQPPGQPPGHLNFWKIFGKFPPPEAKKLFKCPIIGPFQVIKCPHPRETFQWLLLRSGSCVCKHDSIDNTLTCEDNAYGLLTKCEVKMAGYWPSSFFACLWTETKSRSLNSQKKDEANVQPSWSNKLGQ